MLIKWAGSDGAVERTTRDNPPKMCSIVPGTQQELNQHGFPWSMECGEDLPQTPIATDSHKLPMGPMGPGFCGAECGEGPQLQLSHGPGKTSASSLGSLPAPRLSLGDAEGSHGVQTGLEATPVGELMVSLSQAPSRGTGPDQRDPALRIGRRAWKECKHEDIFKLFPAPEIRALEARGPEVSPALAHKGRNSLGTSETPYPTHIHQYPS